MIEDVDRFIVGPLGYGYDVGGLCIFPDPSERFDSVLVDLRRMDESVVTGPDRLEDDSEICEVEDPAEGERRFAGIGGTGGRVVGNSEVIAATVPTEELRLLL